MTGDNKVIDATEMFKTRKVEVARTAQKKAVEEKWGKLSTQHYKERKTSPLQAEIGFLQALMNEHEQGLKEFRMAYDMYHDLSGEIERLNGWRLLKAMSYGLSSMRRGIELRRQTVKALLNV